MPHTNIDELINQAKIQLKSVRDFVRFGVSLFNQNELFYGHGTTNAHDEVVYLILHSLFLPLDVLDPYLDAILLDSECEFILQRFHKRVTTRIPTAYITNEAMLEDYTFYVDERVIIPRSFIPKLILNNHLLPWIEYPELIHNILDLCTGNGSIAIIAADYFEDSSVVASDIDPNTLIVAQININKYALTDRITLVKSDLFNNITDQTFDLILTNPPYVDRNCMSRLTPEYMFEPQHALSGGENGLELIEQILQIAARFLTPHGILVVEMGDNKEELEQLYPKLPFTWLATESGEGFVFVLTRDNLINNQIC